MASTCMNCQRARQKREEHLAAEGYLECKATTDSDAMMRAFGEYAGFTRSEIPFEVVGVKGHPHSAWPFLFLPDSIQSCAGFIPKEQ